MAKGAYVGINGVARKVKEQYVGVDWVARKVAKGYVGVDGVARQWVGDHPPPEPPSGSFSSTVIITGFDGNETVETTGVAEFYQPMQGGFFECDMTIELPQIFLIGITLDGVPVVDLSTYRSCKIGEDELSLGSWTDTSVTFNGNNYTYNGLVKLYFTITY